MTRWLTAAALLLLPALAHACPSIEGLVPNGYQQMTASATAASPTLPAGTILARVIVYSNAIRIRDDGTAPTTTVGMPYGVGANFVLSFESCGPALGRLQIIRDGATNAEVNLLYYKRP